MTPYQHYMAKQAIAMGDPLAAARTVVAEDLPAMLREQVGKTRGSALRNLSRLRQEGVDHVMDVGHMNPDAKATRSGTALVQAIMDEAHNGLSVFPRKQAAAAKSKDEIRAMLRAAGKSKGFEIVDPKPKLNVESVPHPTFPIEAAPRRVGNYLEGAFTGLRL